MDEEVVVHIYKGIVLSHKRSKFESVLARWMNLEPVIWKEKTTAVWYCVYMASRKTALMN